MYLISLFLNIFFMHTPVLWLSSPEILHPLTHYPAINLLIFDVIADSFGQRNSLCLHQQIANSTLSTLSAPTFLMLRCRPHPPTSR